MLYVYSQICHFVYAGFFCEGPYAIFLIEIQQPDTKKSILTEETLTVTVALEIGDAIANATKAPIADAFDDIADAPDNVSFT